MLLDSIFPSKRVLRLTLFILICSIFIGFLSGSGLPVDAAEFESGDSVVITEVRENLYVSGSQVRVESDIRRDLVAAGSEVTIDGSIERNLIAAAGRLNVNSQRIDASVRIAGGEVVLKGVTIGEDLIVAGGIVRLEDVTIAGDLVVSANTLEIRDSTVGGDGFVNYGTYTGDNLDEAVSGELEISENTPSDRDISFDRGSSIAFALGYGFRGQISVIVATLILLVILGRRKRLAISTIKFDGWFVADLLIGISAFVIPFVILPLFAIFAVIPFVGTITLTPAVITGSGIILLLAIFSHLFIVIYLANLVRNSFGLKLGITTTILITLLVWVGIELFTLIPIVGWLVSLLIGVFGLACTGFVLRTLYNAIRYYLQPRTEEFDPTLPLADSAE